MSKNLYIYCEGPTEESFIDKVLAPYFLNLGIYVKPIVCTTKKTPTKSFKGGVTSYKKFSTELSNICAEHSNEYVTTMFDYYGFPSETPMIDSAEVDIYKRMGLIEKAIQDDIGKENCKIHLMPHEFEGILFSDPSVFEYIFFDEDEENIVEKVQAIRDKFDNPEHINNSVETAPSKRLLQLIPSYSKVSEGTTLSLGMGIAKIMEECPHFASWINMLKEWVK